MFNKVGISTETPFKYLITLGVVVFIACSSYILLSKFALMERKMEYHIKHVELEIKGASQAALARYNANAEFIFEELEELRSKLLILSYGGIAGSLTMMVIGLSVWLGRQTNHNKLLKLKVDEAELNNKLLKKTTGLD